MGRHKNHCSIHCNILQCFCQINKATVIAAHQSLMWPFFFVHRGESNVNEKKDAPGRDNAGHKTDRDGSFCLCPNYSLPCLSCQTCAGREGMICSRAH